MLVAEGVNYSDRGRTGGMGLVRKVRFVRCLWPQLDEPTKLFAEGSRQIEVQGPPTPANVIFPPDTVFLPVMANSAVVKIRNGANVAEPKWRQTTIPTRADFFYVIEKQEVPIMGEVERTAVTVIDGVERAVRFSEVAQIGTRVEEVFVVVDIDPADAEQIADIVRDREA